MLKRIHIRGYKSLEDVEVRLSQIVVLFGANAAGKSNLLDALQLLSKLGTSRTLKEAFDPPYRGKLLVSPVPTAMVFQKRRGERTSQRSVPKAGLLARRSRGIRSRRH